MEQTYLSPRTTSGSSDDHHIWNNNGTYWCHFTVHSRDYTKRRVRVSLKTKDRDTARQRRDEIMKATSSIAGRIIDQALHPAPCPHPRT